MLNAICGEAWPRSHSTTTKPSAHTEALIAGSSNRIIARPEGMHKHNRLMKHREHTSYGLWSMQPSSNHTRLILQECRCARQVFA